MHADKREMYWVCDSPQNNKEMYMRALLRLMIRKSVELRRNQFSRERGKYGGFKDWIMSERVRERESASNYTVFVHNVHLHAMIHKISSKLIFPFYSTCPWRWLECNKKFFEISSFLYREKCTCNFTFAVNSMSQCKHLKIPLSTAS